MIAGTAFHAGEQAMHATLGIVERMALHVSPVIRDHMPDQHRAFFPLLPWLLVGSVDEQGQPTASVLAGPPGFVHSPDPQSLRIGARPAADDPLLQHLRRGAHIGLLGLQPHTRRRNRANGVITAIDGGGFDVEIEQSFGNCPKYIQAREARWAPGRSAGIDTHTGQHFDHIPEQALPLLARSDTLFIATAHPDAVRLSDRVPAGQRPDERARGVDISHRGGSPGFLRRDADGSLLLPDYPGNRFFNTIGNLMLNPVAGLLLIDYERGDLLQLSVSTTLETDAALLAGFPGAERVLRFTVRHALWRPAALALAWGPATPSPVLAALGA